ncbi:ATP-binding protein [Paenibacillus ginsengarvi]|uniref:histidine kinase n=1 Tax=Paenibacillus ginsengarvi TaxID=400777 RepID=A0A3B0B6Q0_9BACL|nr:ATP-binding protein [Paenibacillus ginsengarvi]RKN66127.1 hybrid sensor histidine kinase/response regulator [Paenibacillus ginsengarvi]
MPTRGKSIASKLSYLIFTVILLFVAFVLVVGFAINDRIIETRDKLEQELADQARVEKLYIDSQAVVSELRAYLAFGRDDFLNQFLSKRDAFGASLNEISGRFRERGYGEKYGNEWDAIVKAWTSYKLSSDSVIEFRKQGAMDEIEKLSKASTTSNVTDMNRGFQTILSSQDEVVQRWLDDNRMRTDMLILLPILAVAGAAIAGALLVVYLRRKVVRPIVSFDEAVDRIAGGEYALLKLSGRNDELGNLERGINHMSIELRRRHDALEETNKELAEQRDLLEAQNEEISAQQIEQEEMLHKLTERERELELIATYQEKLTGHTEMQSFLEHSIRALLQALHQDAALLITHNPQMSAYDVAYSYGYPPGVLPSSYKELFGPGMRVLHEKMPICRERSVRGDERGLHGGYERAFDQYYPLTDEYGRAVGLLLLTSYGASESIDTLHRMTKGLVKQFALAYMAQSTNEERRKQAYLLEELNEELSQERDGLQQQRDLVRGIIESIPEGMVMCDGRGRIVYANARMNEMFGFDRVSASDINDFCMHLDKLSNGKVRICQDVEAIRSGEREQLHERFSLRREEGREEHYELYVSAIADPAGSDRSFLYVFRDRTNEEMADEMKNEFISIVSHELRTPLASVLGFMEILLNRDVPKDKQKKYMETIYKEANRLSNLIGDFLDLQRMESGKQVYHLLPVDLSALVEGVAEQWQGKLGHRVETFIEEGLVVSADTDRMTQVMHNLCSNAVKYSPNADKIVVNVSKDGPFALIEIIDYGLGIPDEAKGRLFNKFYRVDNSDRRQIGGTGLGLSIVKEIVESHRGEISYESKLGEGSTFRVRLALYKTTSIGGKAVIVEDDENLSKLIAVAFEKLRVPTVQLPSAEDALVSLQETTGPGPLLCIVDIQLEGRKSGWDFIKELLRHPEYGKTPVIVSTVLEQPKHYYETDTGKFLRKPFTIERLLELASSLMTPPPPHATVVFPVQDEGGIASRLEEAGMRVKELKVRQDIIEVEVKQDD